MICSIDNSAICGRIQKICKDYAENKQSGSFQREGVGVSLSAMQIVCLFLRRPG